MTETELGYDKKDALADSLLGVVAEAGADALEKAVKAQGFNTPHLPRAAVLMVPSVTTTSYPVLITYAPAKWSPVLAVAVWEHER